MTIYNLDHLKNLENDILQLKSKPQEEAISQILELNALFTQTPQEKVFSYYLKDIKEKVNQICDPLAPEDRFSQYVILFFQILKFKATNDKSSENLILSEVIYNRSGHPLCISLLFMFLAKELEESLSLLVFPNQLIVKRVVNGKCKFYDTLNNGSEFTKTNLAQLMNYTQSNSEVLKQKNFKTPDAFDLVVLYLNELHLLLRKENQFEKLNIALSLSYSLEPQKHDYLAQRALVRRALGFSKEAVDDLKRYFSFNDKAQAPNQLKMAYYELQAFCQTNPNPEAFH